MSADMIGGFFLGIIIYVIGHGLWAYLHYELDRALARRIYNLREQINMAFLERGIHSQYAKMRDEWHHNLRIDHNDLCCRVSALEKQLQPKAKKVTK